MRKLAACVLALSLMLAYCGLANAATADEAKAMVQKAVAMAKEKGLEATYQAIRDKNGPFFKGELYIFVCDIDTHIMIVHPVKPVLEGKDQSPMKDMKGKLFFLELARTAKEKGSGWVDYYWTKPESKDPALKTTYVERVPGTSVFMGCGFYK